MLTAARAAEIQPFEVMEVLSRANELEHSGRHIVRMEIGEPDFTAPELVVEAAAKAMRDGLTAYTPQTISSPMALKAELAKVRKVGYAVSIEENEPGVCGIAAPIFDHLGHVVAAVNIGGTVLQIKKDNVIILGETVARAAGEMSRRLGYSGKRP